MPRLKSQTGLLTSTGKRNLGTRIKAAGAISAGSPVVLNANGTVSSISVTASTTALSIVGGYTMTGKYAAFERTHSEVESCESSHLAVDPNNKSKFVITSMTSNASPSQAVARVGTIGSDDSISFGAESGFGPVRSGGYAYLGSKNNFIAFDPAQAGRCVITYVDTVSDDAMGVVGTVASSGTGTTISFGSPVTAHSGYMMRAGTQSYGEIRFDTKQGGGKFINMYQISNGGNEYPIGCQIGTLSGTTLTYGAFQETHSWGTNGLGQKPCFAIDPNNAGKIVIFYRDIDNSNQATLKIGTCNYAASTISWGSAQVVDTGDCNPEDPRMLGVEFLPSQDKKFLVNYSNGSNKTGKMRVCSYSGSTISLLGSVITHTDSWRAFVHVNMRYNPDNTGSGDIVQLMGGTNITGWAKIARVNGNAVTFDGPDTSSSTVEDAATKRFDDGNTNSGPEQLNINFLNDGTNRWVGSFFDFDQPSAYTGGIYAFIGKCGGPPDSSNLTSSNFIGFSDSPVADGQPATITSEGAITKTQSGLTAGSNYYIDYTGALSTTPDASVVGSKVPVGTAISATSLLVDPDLPIAENTSDATAVAVSMAIALG